VKHYDVAEAFAILKTNKITTSEESVRRWLRQGIIQGIAPASRKEGWLIQEDNLQAFIYSRLPSHTTNDVKDWDKESIRAEMWHELTSKFIFEGMFEPKKKQLKDCVTHLGLSKDFEQYAWKRISEHTLGYRSPRIPYLLEAFMFDGRRIRLDETYEVFEEKVLYALLEYLRLERTANKKFKI